MVIYEALAPRDGEVSYDIVLVEAVLEGSYDQCHLPERIEPISYL